MVKSWCLRCVVCACTLFAIQVQGTSVEQSAAEYLKNHPDCGFKNAQQVIDHVASLNLGVKPTADDIERCMGRGPHTTELSVLQHIQWWAARILPVLTALSLFAALGLWYFEIEWRELLPERLS